jgi:hypothetical protein
MSTSSKSASVKRLTSILRRMAKYSEPYLMMVSLAWSPLPCLIVRSPNEKPFVSPKSSLPSVKSVIVSASDNALPPSPMRRIILSEPLPAVMVFEPFPPSRVSFPSPPSNMSFPFPP